MSKYEKLTERIRNLDKNLRFDELAKILKKQGYRMEAPRSGSSHRTFRKTGCMPVTLPEHKPMDVAYIKIVKDVLEREGVR